MFDISLPALFGQLVLGLINGSFYALLSIGLAVIFGMLRVINFAHGAQYMLGAYAAWMLLHYLGVSYWGALLLAPLIVGALGAVIERLLLSRIYNVDHLYGLLLTFGLALILEGVFRHYFGTSGQIYNVPAGMGAVLNLGFVFVPVYRAWVIGASVVVCVLTWLLIERTNLGAHLRAATENPTLVQAFGINVPRLRTLAYVLGAGLAGLSGVFAAPVYPISPLMGQSVMIVVFAVVVIGGMGSITGAIFAGYGLGVLEGLTKYFYPEASSTVIFVAMVVVLLVRPSGLMGRDINEESAPGENDENAAAPSRGWQLALVAAFLVLLFVAPRFVYPILLMNVLCFAIFALSFNLLFGYSGLLSFAHAAFFGGAAYLTGHAVKQWGFTPELAILSGIAFAAALGALIGIVALRRRGLYFSMITLAMAQMFYFVCVQAPFTGGENGLQNIPRGNLFGIIPLESNSAMYVFTVVVFTMCVVAMYRIVHSPFGDTVQAIRDNERRAISLGFPVQSYKLAIFVMSAAFAGLAGSMKALVFQFASLTDVSWHVSGDVILMVLVGGVGTILGPIIGSGLVLAITDYFATSDFPVPVALGLTFVTCVLVLRSGVVGTTLRLVRRLWPAQSQDPKPATPTPLASLRKGESI